MNVFVSVDLEGISGLMHPDEMRPDGRDWPLARRLMTAEANAAVAGAFDGGAERVVVNDSHYLQTNLLVEELDERAELIRGSHKPFGMGQGLDEHCDAALLIGYHGRAGGSHGVLNHTWLGKELHDVFVNGEPAGEIALVSALAGHFGAPVALVTGDDAACAEAEALLDGTRTVVVKHAVDRLAARVRHPRRCAAEIRSAAAEAVRASGTLSPHVVEPPIRLEVEWSSTTMAAMCALMPGVEAVAPRRSAHTAQSLPDALRAFVAMTLIAEHVGQQPPYS